MGRAAHHTTSSVLSARHWARWLSMSSWVSLGAKTAWHMGQLCSVGNPSTDGCSSALEVPRGSGAGCRWGDQAEDPVRPRASRSTRSQSLGSPPRRGAGGKGVQEKVSVPTMKLSGGARSGLRLGSWPGNAGSGGGSPSTFSSAYAARSSSAHGRAHSPPSGGEPGGLLGDLWADLGPEAWKHPPWASVTLFLFSLV